MSWSHYKQVIKNKRVIKYFPGIVKLCEKWFPCFLMLFFCCAFFALFYKKARLCWGELASLLWLEAFCDNSMLFERSEIGFGEEWAIIMSSLWLSFQCRSGETFFEDTSEVFWVSVALWQLFLAISKSVLLQISWKSWLLHSK